MKFGKSLSEKVREDWKEYAVDYKGMKKTLPDKDTALPLDQSTCSDGGADVSNSDSDPLIVYAKYWALYKSSQDAVTAFYKQKDAWASSEYLKLQSRVEKYRLSKTPGSIITTGDTGSFLHQLVVDYRTELDFFREFISINYTAFYKILKKYDKRTYCNVREKKLEEILVTHPFMDGSAMADHLHASKKLLNTLDKIDAVKRRVSNPPDDDDASDTAASSSESGAIVATAKSILDQIAKSPFFTKYKSRRNPTFKEKEIKVGDYLGEGEFSIVREVSAFNVKASCPICMIHTFKDAKDDMESSESTSQINSRDEKKSNSTSIGVRCAVIPNDKKLKMRDKYSLSINAADVRDVDMESFQDDHEDEDNEIVANKGFMKHHCFRDGSARYAIKQLKNTLPPQKLADGAIDLCIEAKFLSVLSHSNIIKLCGIGGEPGHPNSFLILDRLYDTLDERIGKWSEKEKGLKFTNFLNKKKSQLQLLWTERLLAGYDIARAMKYIHSHDIIYRDIKPENIGFDVRGNAKLFDFGLAKELTEKDKVDTDQYHASGRTGTRRYMAPEVVLCKYYGKPADVFSFSLLLWEIVSLTQPFKGYDYEKHAKLVVQKKKRPDCKKDWPTLIKMAIKQGWDDNPAARPSFCQICDNLAGQFVDNDGLSRSERLMNSSVREIRMLRLD